MTKTKTVNDWLEWNRLTSDSFARTLGCSKGAVDKWRQELSYPSQVFLLVIKAAIKKNGWTEFPERE